MADSEHMYALRQMHGCRQQSFKQTITFGCCMLHNMRMFIEQDAAAMDRIQMEIWTCPEMDVETLQTNDYYLVVLHAQYECYSNGDNLKGFQKVNKSKHNIKYIQ